MALTGYRNTLRMGDSPHPEILQPLNVKGNVNCHQGALIVMELATGLVKPGVAATGLLALGKCETQEGSGNNTGGADSAITIAVRTGTHKWANSAAADAIVAASVGQTCYVVDDQTVALTDNNGARSPAGQVVQVDTDGVWVHTEPFNGQLVGSGSGASPQAGSVVGFTFDLADISAADIVSKFVPGFAGRIKAFQAVVLKAATTGAKAATITPQINPAGGADVAVTGGGLALTSANMTPIGNTVASAAITGANSFGAADGISLKGSGITTFVEGRVLLLLTFA